MLAFPNSGQSSTLISPDAVNSGRFRQGRWRRPEELPVRIVVLPWPTMAIRRHGRYCTIVSVSTSAASTSAPRVTSVVGAHVDRRRDPGIRGPTDQWPLPG